MVLCVLEDVLDNILNVEDLGSIVREHLGLTLWTQHVLRPVLLDSIQSCNTH